jgi:hypothetical protein
MTSSAADQRSLDENVLGKSGDNDSRIDVTNMVDIADNGRSKQFRINAVYAVNKYKYKCIFAVEVKTNTLQ